jgi:hypothetical protein
MAAPQKQPLISAPTKTTTHGIVRRASVRDNSIIFVYFLLLGKTSASIANFDAVSNLEMKD